MKKIILTAIAVAGLSVGAYAQGTVVFQNFLGGVNGLVYSNSVPGTTNGATLSIGTTSVELFSGPMGDTAAQLLALNNGVIFSYNITAGKFYDGATIAAAGTPLGDGSTLDAEFLIAGWVGSAASYSAAVTAGLASGTTAAFANATGGGGSPTAAAANLTGWLAANPLIIAPVPEPATILLGGLGAASLLLFRRRK